tara:strand:- start:463 stop:1236 length:774 start_codon:yes stop_codon:yes gene_type:complete
MNKILSLNDPNIKEFLNLKEFNLKNENHICAQSEKVVLKLLQSPFKTLKVFATESFFSRHEKVFSSKLNIKKLVAEKALIKTIIGHNHHQGVFALAERPSYYPIESLDSKILILNGLTSPENVGSLCRTAAAFNINSIVIDHKTVNPYLKRPIRVSMGNIFQLKVHLSEDLPRTLSDLKKHNYKIFGTANEEGSTSVESSDLPERVALIIGSEGHGIEPEIKSLCDNILKINVNQNVMHLNAASAGAIFLYELSKKR